MSRSCSLLLACVCNIYLSSFCRVVGGFETLTDMENVESDPKTDKPKVGRSANYFLNWFKCNFISLHDTPSPHSTVSCVQFRFILHS